MQMPQISEWAALFYELLSPANDVFTGTVPIQMPQVIEWAAVFCELLLPANDVFCRGWCQYKAMSCGCQGYSCLIIAILVDFTTEMAFGGCALITVQKR